MVILLAVVIISACQKEKFTNSPDARLSFSIDTLVFDTVFVTVGSATRNFKVKNPNSESVRISSIGLAGGPGSFFRINIDGHAVTELTDYELAAGDSMFVFVEVTIDPNTQALPFIVSDSIIFVTNTNVQKVQLAAYGQNANFHNAELLPCDAIWKSDLPHVIFNSVLVPPGCKLTIEAGAKIYSHSGSGIFVQGMLEVNGAAGDPVIFRGDRLEHLYDKEPGQWYGIRLLPKSEGNIIRHAEIRNAVVGIQADSLPVTSGSKNLIIEKSRISYMSSVGLIGYTATIEARNILIHSCGLFLFVGDLGGSYTFEHCTFENGQSLFAQKYPCVTLTNTDYKNGSEFIINPLSYTFRNCIIWGSLENEIDVQKKGQGLVTSVFSSNIVRTTKDEFKAGNIANTDPRFLDVSKADYHLKDGSPAINNGEALLPPVTDDLENNPRTDTKPDIGCYEKQ
ncbi:MAG: hypothetical protein M3Q97_04165 [Bacteroidota bacterium]|nr:hypothetical protein [Bacteroidota bacterium]